MINSMSTCSKCNKVKPNMIIINTNEFSLAEYLKFKESNTDLCIECFLKR